MACFVVPVAEAVVVSAVYAVMRSKEKKYDLSYKHENTEFDTENKKHFSGKLV